MCRGRQNLSVGGTLKMKRDDVVQLSLTVLGIEVGRLEFTPKDVLIVDRVNKQYVRARYDQVAFLQTADLDFYAFSRCFGTSSSCQANASLPGSCTVSA